MYSNFKEQGIEYGQQAVAEDNAGNYAKAFPLYMNALEYLKTHLKYEKDPKVKEEISQKFTEYLHRAEQIRAILEEEFLPPPQNAAAILEGDPNCSTQPFNSEEQALIDEFGPGEKIAYFKEQAVECVKQAVAEDNEGNHAKAFPLYMNALWYFKMYLTYGTNPKIKEAIVETIPMYLRRAKEIRAKLNEGPDKK